jgi:ketosteroid isomerase-like protein
MSQQNVAAAKSFYEAMGRGDIPAALGMMAPAIEWREADNFLYADGNPYIGPQRVLEGVFARLAGNWDGFAAIPEQFLDAGETVVVTGRYHGTCKATGRAVKAQFVHMFTFLDGKIARFQQYTDTLQFAKAAGTQTVGA